MRLSLRCAAAQAFRAGGRFRVAGPSRSSPSLLKREPWSGQSHVRSLSFQCTMPPRWVQTADSLQVVPSTVETATGRVPSRYTCPWPSSGTTGAGAGGSWFLSFLRTFPPSVFSPSAASCPQPDASLAATPALRETAESAPDGDVIRWWMVLAHGTCPPRMSAAIPKDAATALVMPHLL